MAKIYLEPGREFILAGGPVRVGATATNIDSVLDWTGVALHSASGGKLAADNVVGTIVNSERLSFDVRLEQATGRFWYDDECGY